MASDGRKWSEIEILGIQADKGAADNSYCSTLIPPPTLSTKIPLLKLDHNVKKCDKMGEREQKHCHAQVKIKISEQVYNQQVLKLNKWALKDATQIRATFIPTWSKCDFSSQVVDQYVE